MRGKQILRALLRPHIAVLLVLLPLAAAALPYAMLTLDEQSPVRIGVYVLSAYTLTVWCVRVPDIIRFFRTFRQENKYARRWLSDTRLRVNVTLSASALFNAAYAAMQLELGLYHRAVWFYALAGYYLLLAVMRLVLARYSLRNDAGAQPVQELRRYRVCGWCFLVMNLALTVVIFYMLHENRIVRHHPITSIAMAAYTFTAFTLAVVNLIRYRRYNSPVYSAAKAISLASACVSMLTLEGTMLASFSTPEMTAEKQLLFLALTGVAVSAFIVAMAIYMISGSSRKIKQLESQNGTEQTL